jgi:hypothetical protein
MGAILPHTGGAAKGGMGHFAQKILYKNGLFYLDGRAKNA